MRAEPLDEAVTRLVEVLSDERAEAANNASDTEQAGKP